MVKHWFQKALLKRKIDYWSLRCFNKVRKYNFFAVREGEENNLYGVILRARTYDGITYVLLLNPAYYFD